MLPHATDIRNPPGVTMCLKGAVVSICRSESIRAGASADAKPRSTAAPSARGSTAQLLLRGAPNRSAVIESCM